MTESVATIRIRQDDHVRVCTKAKQADTLVVHLVIRLRPGLRRPLRSKGEGFLVKVVRNRLRIEQLEVPVLELLEGHSCLESNGVALKRPRPYARLWVTLPQTRGHETQQQIL